MNESEGHTARQIVPKKGLVIVNTGDGKGKTTAALGIVLRAWGRDMRVCVVQFLKHEHASFGETLAAEKLGIEWTSTGDGWTWASPNLEETQAKTVAAWEMAKRKIISGQYDIVVLDEFTYPLYFGWLDTEAVVEWLRTHKPPLLHVIITGRYAPQLLMDFADLVTEMREVKHPFAQQKIRAQAGIEF
ncbi:MAG: cob(I)yrinic acid a,c-diamide adenosyltransferase [Anaerolineae bacterium]